MSEITKAHCNNCGSGINHHVINREEVIDKHQIYDDLEISWGNLYFVLKCCGCDAVKLKHEHWFSEDCDDKGRPNVTTTYYPSSMFRKEPDWLHLLDKEWHIMKLLREVYTALQNDCLRLAAMGIRALLESLMLDKISDQGSFVKNIKSFRDQGFISTVQERILESALEVGHASIHRGFCPKKVDIIFAIDLTEGLIQHLYILNNTAESVKRNLPSRNA